ncbi:MAG: aminotransferase class V-fold PLP-dependent enzyme [Gemmatimonadales bacterium]|nr:MAG: aminotransferase class V-fold PLP-dependent enzyme [Gemmatimonadales bacterium]
MATAPLSCQKDHFQLPEGLHYLNCAYMGPLPRVVEEAGVRALRTKRDPTGIVPRDFFEESDRVREKFARIVGASDSSRIAIHPSVSYGVATAARNLPLARGARIVLVEEQFPGNVYSWRRLASEAGAALHTVARPEGAQVGREWNERILDAITPVTEIVTLPTVHWTDGTRFDLPAIADRARDVGAALVVDATQSCGAVPFDFEAVRPDVFMAAAYKWLLGPYSLAFTYLGDRFDHGTPLEETWIGRKGSEDFKGLVHYTDEYQPGAIRYDVGERSNFALLPAASVALDLILQWSPARIAEYVRRLAGPLLNRAAELGFGVEEDAFRSPHLFGLKMPEGLVLEDVRNALEERRVFVSLRGSSLRISPNVYNSGDDVEALLDALEGLTR